jgi:hypothetical protein
LARREAKTMRVLTAGPRPIPEREQLADYERRLAQEGLRGFDDIAASRGPKAVADFIQAMTRLQRKLKKGT